MSWLRMLSLKVEASSGDGSRGLCPELSLEALVDFCELDFRLIDDGRGIGTHLGPERQPPPISRRSTARANALFRLQANIMGFRSSRMDTASPISLTGDCTTGGCRQAHFLSYPAAR